MSPSIREFLSGRAVRIAAAVVFTAIMVLLMVRNVSVDTLSSCIAQLKPVYALWTIVAYLGIAAARAGRYLLVGAGVSFRGAFEIALMHAAMLRIMPLRSGELAYGFLLKRRNSASLAKSLTDIVLLRVLDMAVVLPMAAFVVALLLKNTVSFALEGMAAAVGGLFLGLFFFGGRLSRSLKHRFAAPDTGWMHRVIFRITEIMADSFSLPRKTRFQLLGLTLLMWAGLICWFYFAFLTVGIVNDFSEGAAAGTMGIVGSMLPLSLIGSFGPLEGGIAGGLIAIGHPHRDALAEALVVSLITFLCNCIPAAFAWISFSLDHRDGSPKKAGIVFRRALGAVLFSLGAAVVLLTKIPYGFETNDQLQYLLLPYREIYAPFLTGDWFTWQTSHYHPFFGFFIRGLHFVSGESGFPTAVFLAHGMVLCGLGYACLFSARALKLHWFSAAAAILVVAFVRRYGLAEVVVNHGVLLPSDMAMPFLLLGFAAWIAEKPLTAGLLLGVAGLIHANFAVIGPMVLAVPELRRLLREKQPVRSLRLVGGFLVLAWPSLVTAGLGFFTADAAPSAIEILFEYRSPHHYHPQIFATKEAYWPIALLTASIPIWWARHRAGAGRATQVLLALIASQVIAYVAVEGVHSATLVRLFLWRLSIPLILFSAAAFGETWVAALRTRRPTTTVFALLATVLVLSFMDGGPILRKGWTVDWARISTTLSKSYFPDGDKIEGKKHPLPILSWIDRHAPRDAVFLVPPGMDNFRLEAKRAIFVDWKCCPMKGDEIAEWARRMNAAMGTKRLPAKGYALHRAANLRYAKRSLASLADLAKKEGMTHILAKDSRTVPDTLKKLVTKSGWSVYRVR